MNKSLELTTVLIAEDDPDDRLMIKEYFEDEHISNPLYFVEDGDELVRYLKQRADTGSFQDIGLPGVILLDLHMPRRGGHEVLAEIKSDDRLRKIPIIVLTTSKAEEDIKKAYELGVNSYITKPSTFEAFKDTMGVISKYWLKTVELPK